MLSPHSLNTWATTRPRNSRERSTSRYRRCGPAADSRAEPRSPVEHLLHHRPGTPGRASVVVDQPSCRARRVAQDARDAGELAQVAGQVCRRAGRGPAVSRCAPGSRCATRARGPAVCSASSRPASCAARSASRVRVVRSPGTRPACRSCSSCTVHSTSASPPGPSLVCRCGSVPRGSRSASTRALIRRTSRTSASVEAALAVAHRVDQRDELPAELRRRRRSARPAAAPGSPRPATTARSRPRRTRASAPAGPAGPRAAGRRRRPAAGPATVRRAAGAAPPRPRARPPRRRARRPRRAGRGRTARRRRWRSRARDRRTGPSR